MKNENQFQHMSENEFKFISTENSMRILMSFLVKQFVFTTNMQKILGFETSYS